jgi:hypothetical protein
MVNLKRVGLAAQLMVDSVLRLLETSTETESSISPHQTTMQWIFFLGTETARSKDRLPIKPHMALGLLWLRRM